MRRFRLLLAAAVVVIVGTLGLSAGSVSHAQEAEPTTTAETPEISHTSEECIKLLEEGKTIDDCQAAPNPLLPEPNEIIWGAIAFLIVFLFLWKYGVPAVKTGMQARSDRIRDDLEKAEAQREEAETVLSEYRAQLADAKTEGSRIIEEARQTADAMKRDLAASAEADIAAMRQKAAADIEAAKVQAIADLRGEVANIAIGAAERVVERSLDRETSTQLVESFINQVGADS